MEYTHIIYYNKYLFILKIYVKVIGHHQSSDKLV